MISQKTRRPHIETAHSFGALTPTLAATVLFCYFSLLFMSRSESAKCCNKRGTWPVLKIELVVQIWRLSQILWLVVYLPLWKMCHLGLWFPIHGKITNVPNHQPDIVWLFGGFTSIDGWEKRWKKAVSSRTMKSWSAAKCFRFKLVKTLRYLEIVWLGQCQRFTFQT